MYQRLCDTQIQKRGSIVLFTHYSQRNAPNRRPYRPKAINVRGEEVHENLFFIAVIVEKGRTEERRSQAQNVFMYAFPRYRQEKNTSCMVLSARQQSKVIKMLGLF